MTSGARGVHHVALRTRDVEALAAFYARAFGLPRERRAADERGLRAVWLRAGDTIVMIERAEPKETRVPVGSRDALLFAIAPAERLTMRRRFARMGVPLDGETDFSLYVRDPDGRRVGVSHFPDASPENTKTRRPRSSGSRGRRSA